MNKILLLSFVISAVLFTSCNKEEKLKERLNGKWIYEKAEWQEKAFKKKDILDTYRFIDVYFTYEGALELIDVRDSLVFFGNYALEDYTETLYTDENGNQIPVTTTEMLVTYTDTASKIEYQELWDNVSIGKNKIRFETELDGSKAHFVLRRQLND